MSAALLLISAAGGGGGVVGVLVSVLLSFDAAGAVEVVGELCFGSGILGTRQSSHETVRGTVGIA